QDSMSTAPAVTQTRASKEWTVWRRTSTPGIAAVPVPPDHRAMAPTVLISMSVPTLTPASPAQNASTHRLVSAASPVLAGTRATWCPGWEWSTPKPASR
ncbi:hypothetical protein FKM82_030046, partial [Ascaphus truei]